MSQKKNTQQIGDYVRNERKITTATSVLMLLNLLNKFDDSTNLFQLELCLHSSGRVEEVFVYLSIVLVVVVGFVGGEGAASTLYE